MRLTEKQLQAIKEAFASNFLEGDRLWLFGSRVDDTKRGGDIDLYVETFCDDEMGVMKRKTRFSVDIQKKIGEQRIDIVVNEVQKGRQARIYDEAKNTGVRLV